MGLGHIERRRGKNGALSYRARITLPPAADGRRQSRSATFPTEKAAQTWIVAELGRVHRGLVDTGATMRLRDYLTLHWLPFYQSLRSPASYVIRESACRTHIIPALGHLPLGKITTPHVQAFYTDLGTTLAPNTVGSIASTLSAALRAAVDWGMIYRSPCQGARVPRVVRRDPTIWTSEQTRTFLSHETDPAWRCLWAVLAETGMRVGELLALRWGDVDWASSTLRIERTVTRAGKGQGKTIGPTKTARGTREVALSLGCIFLLRNAHEPGVVEGKPPIGRNPVIFPLTHDQVFSRFRRLSAALGLPLIRLHDLRHGNVVTGLEAGIPLVVISERLGHSSIRITGDTYAHVTRKLNRQSADIIARLLLGDGVGDDGA